MPKLFTSKQQKKGEFAERVAERFLIEKGFSILERNYTRKWGEIDIVALKGSIVHFVEVKSGVFGSGYRPEENMHASKAMRMRRIIQSYLAEEREKRQWQVDLVTVLFEEGEGAAHVRVLENIII